MATIIEEFIATLNWDVDEKGLKTFSENVSQVTDLAKKAAVAIAGATVAAVGFAVITNKQTAINNNLAASVGLSAESYDAWSGLLKQVGFDGERVLDMVEEMNNKLGELKGMGEFISAEESLQMLGLRFKEIKDLAPEEQFLKILSTAKEMEDQQKAVSAVDMLMGGEANRVLGFLRTMDGDLQDIIKRRLQLNILDKEAREGAVKFTAVWSDFESLLGSIGAQFSGVLGEVITPIVNEFIDWATANRELLKANIRGFVAGFASIIKTTIPWLKALARWFSNIIESLGGFKNTMKLAGIALSAFAIVKLIQGFKALALVVKAATVWQALWNAAVVALPFLIAAAILLVAEDIFQFMTGGESVTEKVIDSIVGMWEEAVPIVEGYISDAVSFWANTLGVTEKEIDEFLLSIEDGFKATFDFVAGIYDGAVEDFEAFIGKAVGLLKRIPLVGNLFAGLPSLGLSETFNAAPGPSQSAVSNSNSRSVVINSSVDMSVPTGAAGADPAGTQTRMRDYWEEEVSKAARALDTGVVY